LKKKYLSFLAIVVIIMILSLIQYNNIKEYYDKLHNPLGGITENLDKKLVEENQQAIKAEEEYQKLLEQQKDGDIFSQGKDNYSSAEIDNSKSIDNKDSNSIESKEPLSMENDGQNSAERENEEVLRLNKRLHALSALLLDADNNRVLYEKNGDDELPMASTTKIMTCIVALENSKPEDIVEVSAYAAKMPDVQLNIKAGECYYMKDLLYSLMLESHNDSAVAIAEHVGGSVEGFAVMMNDKARALGCSHTNFVTPNGLDANGHYTTAKELAIIASYAIKNEKFIEITNTLTHSFQEINKKRQFTVSNKNKFLHMMDGAIGVKTGFTGKAGYCFVGAIKRPDRTLISVVLASGWPPRKSLKWSDTMELMRYGVDQYQVRQIFMEQELPPMMVKKGQSSSVKLKYDGKLKLLMREDEKVTFVYELPEYLMAPVKADKEVGKLKYYINHELLNEIPVYAVEDVKKINFKYCLQELIHLWYGNYTKQ
jgi:D-alanyl-D-alanine carboxypeptidase (penicillin-binding protein 5/6)